MARPDLNAIAFPALDDAQLAQLEACPTVSPQTCEPGEVLQSAGETACLFFVITDGEVEAVSQLGPASGRVSLLRRGQFTGDTSQLAGGITVVGLVARTAARVLKITPESLRRALEMHPMLGDVFLSAFLARWQLTREPGGATGLHVIGSRYSADTFRIRDFLARNHVPIVWLDLETDPRVGQLLARFGVTPAETPVAVCGRSLLLKNPSNRELGDAIGIHRPPTSQVYDLAVVGAGPAGLAAAVYAASEGLKTVVLESLAPGGQASLSMRIENYLGFPAGVTGKELAGRALLQVHKFSAHVSVPAEAVSLALDGDYPVITLDDGAHLTTRCLLLACGAEYKRLGVEGCSRFEGTGVYYTASESEGRLCSGSVAVVIGGGNSAGQAAVYLSGHAREVVLVVRSPDLTQSMSAYLIQRIESIPNIRVLYNTVVLSMDGDDHLASVHVKDTLTGHEDRIATSTVFSFIGAAPRTGWLPAGIEKDDYGFVRTGSDVAGSAHWTAKRPPFLLETSRSGVFAAGDVRSGSVKRVASAVGEGSMAIQFVHEYLKSR